MCLLDKNIIDVSYILDKNGHIFSSFLDNVLKC